ncbi:MAG: DUF1924 domain-containing protein [Methylococcales bacterium]|nr:DUF1924 domain-containing protein [Methylococcales bacterium]
MQIVCNVVLAFFGFISFSAQAGSDIANQFARQFNVARSLAAEYGQEAQKLNKNSKLSAEAGRAFYVKKVIVGGKELSCSACHTDNPAKEGKHNETGKPIKPLAVSANPDRFSDPKKVEKNFSDHCRDLYKKDCSAQDKGDYLTYLLSVQ